MKQRVALTDVRFFAHHGYYPEEQVLGTEFIVNVQVWFEKHTEGDDELQSTVNYQLLYQLVQNEMQRPRRLLETVTESILNRIRTDFSFLEEIEVSICKSHPPFGGDRAKAVVALIWKS